MARVEHPDLVSPLLPLLPFVPSVQPRGKGKKCPPGWQPSKDTGKPLCRPPCSTPASLDRLVGSGGAVGVGSLSLLAPDPQEKQGCLPGEFPLWTDARQPRPAWARVGTVLDSLHGKASRALPWRAHRTLQFKALPDDHCLAQPQGPGAPGPDLSLSFPPPSRCPCPSLVPSGGPPCGAGAQGPWCPPAPVPYRGSRGTGLSVVLNYRLPGQGGRRPPPAPGSCRWPQHVPQTALPLRGLPGPPALDPTPSSGNPPP